MNIPEDINARDYFAIHAPCPTEEDIVREMKYDSSRNPYNDPHKPELRSRLEITAYLRYKFADAMLLARGK